MHGTDELIDKRAGAPAALPIDAAAGHEFDMHPEHKDTVAGGVSRFQEWISEQGFLKDPHSGGL